MSDTKNAPLPRQVADSYVDALIELDPITGTYLGVPESSRRLPDFSPDGAEAVADLSRTTLARLAEAEARPGADGDAERRCARLLRERLTAELAVHDAHEGLRAVSNLSSPLHSVRGIFTVMPSETEEDWAAVAARLRAVPAALEGYRASLAEGLRRNLPAGPRQVATVLEQLTEWIGTDGGWFADFTAEGPDALRGELDEAAAEATGALVALRDWLRETYARPSRAPPMWWGASATAAGPGCGTAPISTWTRRTRTAGRNSTASTPRCAPRPRRSCPAPTRGRRCAISTPTVRISRASRRRGCGCRS
ncbi:hypothetical protein SANT12839_082310 [Streptomyces antimycoticus]|uniref:DUF885 domain-containing protein n=1 Tax=Streptomyces antimycoticus TaxID=68175 RepID=A0A4D4KNB0_9ACTN|nr:hypothetical protein SANT12839_082310 [Streptomyces antimycoticus]